MKDKIFKAIKCVLFMLPFVFVGGTTLYTIFNENAKDSADFGTTYTLQSTTSQRAVSGSTLLFQYDSSVTIQPYTPQFKFYECSFPFNEIQELTFTPNQIMVYSNGTIRFDDTINGLNLFIGNIWGVKYFQFTLVLDSLGGNYFNGGSARVQNMYPLERTLDTAFEYSLSEFNKIGFGKIDFLEWFNDIFLNNNFNNVYSTFINSYLNYFLFVELVMFIPSVFHWVIHFFTEIGNNVISKSTDKKKGD